MACVLLFWMLFGMAWSALAASPGYVTLAPKKGETVAAEAHAVYFREEEGKKLDPNQVWSMYQARQSGSIAVSPSGYAHTGWSGGAVWIVMPVNNQTDINDWKLELTANSFFVHPRFNDIRIVQGETGLGLPARTASDGTAIIGLPKRLAVTLIIRAEVADGWPVILRPSFIPAGEDVKIVNDWASIAWMVAVIVSLYMFAVSALPWRSTPALMAIGTLFQALWISGAVWQGTHTPVIGAMLLVAAAGTSYLTAAFLFARSQSASLRYTHKLRSRDLVIPGAWLAALILATILIFVWPDSILPILMLLMAGSMVTSVLMFWRVLVQFDAPSLWPILGLLIGVMGQAATLPVIVDAQLPAPYLLTLAPLSVLLQALILLLWGMANRMEEVTRTAMIGAEPPTRKPAKKTELSSKLKASQDSYDQDRLLRVLEQERAQMEVLRDSERRKTNEMRRAKDAADEAIRAKSAFFAVLGHEIRTPMNGILGMVKLLLKSNITKEQRQYASTIMESGAAMMTILNDMLDFEKIESGKMSFEKVPFDLPHMMGSISTLMQGHAMAKGLSLVLDVAPDVPQLVVSDPTRLRQVVLNLVSNAIKFTESGSVTIIVRPIAAPEFNEQQGRKIHQIYFGVQDTGLGIPRESQKNLFNPFSQADASISRKFGGTGLGLAICQKLVERMGGNININSKEGEGSTFFFAIPMGEALHEEAANVVNIAAMQAPMPDMSVSDIPAQMESPIMSEIIPAQNVLVIDDNPINHRVIEGFLASAKHRLKFAENVSTGWRMLTNGDTVFDLVLMDLELPDGNGAALTSRLRLEGGQYGVNVPVVGLTGHTDAAILQECIDSGMNDVLIKPVDPEALQAVMLKVRDKAYPKAAVKIKPPTAPSSGQPAAAPAAPAAPSAAPAPAAEAPAMLFPGQRSAGPASDDEFSAGLNAARDQMKQSQAVAAEVPEVVMLFDPATLTPLKETLGNDAVKSLLEDLYVTSEQTISAMQTALANENWDEIRARAHDLKGMSGNFGLKDLSKRASVIDHALRQGLTNGIADKVRELPQAFTQSREELTRWLVA